MERIRCDYSVGLVTVGKKTIVFAAGIFTVSGVGKFIFVLENDLVWYIVTILFILLLSVCLLLNLFKIVQIR